MSGDHLFQRGELAISSAPSTVMRAVAVEELTWAWVGGGGVLMSSLWTSGKKGAGRAIGERTADDISERTTHETRWCREGGAHGRWADVTSLEPTVRAPLLHCFFLLGEKGNGRAERGGPPSLKKAIRERRRERLKRLQWESEKSSTGYNDRVFRTKAIHNVNMEFGCGQQPGEGLGPIRFSSAQET